MVESGVARLHLVWRSGTTEADLALSYAPCPLRQLLTTLTTQGGGLSFKERFVYVP